MELTILFGTFTVLLLIGTPIAFCLGIASLATITYLGIPPLVVFQRINSGMNAFALLAIPFFVYAGDLMLRGRIAEKLVAFAAALVGHVRGGLGLVNVLSSTFFGGVSGSAVADASAIGGLMVPQMKARGYPVDYAVNATIFGSVIALLVPPSHNMIIYSISAGGTISVADLFTAGIVPGLLLAMALMLTAWLIAVKRGFPREPFPGWAMFAKIAVTAIPGLILILIIFGGVRSGYFTATESSCVAAVYAFLITMFAYRSLTWDDFVEATLGAVKTTSMVLLLIGCAESFGWLLALLQVPAKMILAMQAITDQPLVIFILINVILLVMGMFMDMSPLIVITTPIFLPVVKAFGMDPIHFGVILILNLGIGLLSPPVGTVLFVGCAIGKITIAEAMRSSLWFYLAAVIVLLIVTYVPAVSLFLPHAFR
ncbi:MAG: TRAP transporter large permease subunit [Azospirillum sp.]|nr:TRAP transporter large permease subunit [Azospirillum sp.]